MRLANTVQTSSILIYLDIPLLETASMASLRPLELSNVAWSCATVSFRKRVKELTRSSWRCLTEFSPECLAVTAWSLAELRADKDIFDAIATVAMTQVSAFAQEDCF